MIDNFLKIIKETTWFMNSGVAPRNVSDRIRPSLENVNHMTSKKFAMTIIAIFIIALMYFSSVACLFLFKADPHVSALVSMYKDMIVAVASIAATLVGIQGLVDWKYNSNSNIELKSTDNNNDFLTSNTKEDDYNISDILL